MKKCILFVLLVICMDALCQRISESRYKLGGKIGVVSANITGGRVKSGSRIVFEGGIWCQVKLSKNWTGQAELIYVEKGTDFKTKYPGTGAYAVALMYLECPVLFQYHIKKFTLEGGPGLGVLIYQTEVLVGAPTPNMTTAYPFSKGEFSFNVGCGYSLNDKWYVGLRFTHSVLPVRRQIADIPRDVYNRVFALTFARHIPFKKEKTAVPD